MTTSSVEKTHQTAAQLPGIDFLFFPRRSKLHNYANCKYGVDYLFEAIDSLGSRGYMTAQCRRVEPGDRVLLKQGDALVQYQVKEIDYYASPSDMWIGLLSKV